MKQISCPRRHVCCQELSPQSEHPSFIILPISTRGFSLLPPIRTSIYKCWPMKIEMSFIVHPPEHVYKRWLIRKLRAQSTFLFPPIRRPLSKSWPIRTADTICLSLFTNQNAPIKILTNQKTVARRSTVLSSLSTASYVNRTHIFYPWPSLRSRTPPIHPNPKIGYALFQLEIKKANTRSVLVASFVPLFLANRVHTCWGFLPRQRYSRPALFPRARLLAAS